jgi:hypothetical protein
MNLRWNGTYRRFEAEFSADFQGDLAAVKAAGFRTDGAPEWIWYTYKAGPLGKLRENRPPSGLTITPEAKEQFVSLWAVEEKNAKLKAEIAEHNKTLKKKLKIADQDAKASAGPQMKMCSEGYLCLSKEDLPLAPPFAQPRPEPSLKPNAPKCIICTAAVYFYEKLDPPTCLWCEKIVLDNASEVC